MFVNWLIAFAVLVQQNLVVNGQAEEFQVRGPMDLHDLAMKKFMEIKRADPTANLSHDGEFLTAANEHAIKRMSRKPDEAFVLRRYTSSNSDTLAIDGEEILALPSPEAIDHDTVLQQAVNTQGSAGALILPQQSRANAMIFSEEIGTGAISKTGALPMGSEGEWLSLAEDKLKKDASLDYQSLLWEMGTELAETAMQEHGTLNITHEEELLERMEKWFIAGGGKLQFAKPTVNEKYGFRLVATEDIHEYDPVVTVPFKLLMCKQTARNVMIQNRGKYLGEELQKTFEKNELWGLTVFLLHEYYKEVNGGGSKWGPFIRTLRMRSLSTPALQSLRGTIAAHLSNQWMKSSDSFMWWSVGADGPCSPTTNICKAKPNDRGGESRFNIHQIRWAYWVVKQNAVRIRQVSTGLEFAALIPYYGMIEKRLDGGGEITFDLDGSVSIRAGHPQEDNLVVGIHPGNFTDAEFFLRYMTVPKHLNANNEVKLSLPGAIPKGSKFHYCMKGTQKQQNQDDCKASFKSESMFWKSKVLTEWRSLMNLPPRLQELRMWATRLHLYGGQEEMALLSNANRVLADLPIPVDQMGAEEQLMLMGVARDNMQAAVIAAGPAGDRPPPQLYSAPDPTEDWEAQRGMENLAMLAVQAQKVISSGNVVLNATQVVLNATRDFFVHGVLPMAGLDELDMFLLKKIGMLAHCGFENDMKIVHNNITDELMCAMRVHLMNETEIFVFCPKEARVWEENCLNVEFANYTAISENNELAVVQALRASIHGLLASYPTTSEEDSSILQDYMEGLRSDMGEVMAGAISLRFREKEILHTALTFLDDHEASVRAGNVTYQLEQKALERAAADLRTAEHKKFMEDVKARALIRPELAFVEVDMGAGKDKVNLTLAEGHDLKQTVVEFCQKYGVVASYVPTLEKALRGRVRNPDPLNLMLGVIIPATGDRKILAIPVGENINATIETGVFCAQNDITEDVTATAWCQGLLERVNNRLNTTFSRKILLVVPIDAPDGRKLQLVIREGEQHDLVQFVSDFFQLYHLNMDMVMGMANEVHKRLPAVEIQVPISLGTKRSIQARFSRNDNITNVVEAFANFYEINDEMKIAILKRARNDMAPGTYML